MPAGKLIKIDCEIWDLRNRLVREPDNTALRERIDDLVKEREAVVLLIAKDGTAAEAKSRLSAPLKNSK